MSRRSLYCTKDASGKYSLSHFDDADGNILRVTIPAKTFSVYRF